jgi:hypothetical protein
MVRVRLPRSDEWLDEQGMGGNFRTGIGLDSGSATRRTRRPSGRHDDGHQLVIADSTHAMLGDDAAGLVHYGDLPVRGRQRKLTVWLPEWDGELETPKSGLSWLIRRKTATGAKEQIMLARSHGEVPPGPADGVVASPELRDHA